MIRLLKSLIHRFYKFVSFVIGGILGVLFGKLTWQAPWWLRKIGGLFCGIGRFCKRHPKGSLIGVLVLGVLGGAGGYGYYWYINQPKPYTVAYSVKAPQLTNYARQPIGVDVFSIRFVGSVAPLEMIGNPVTTGITISPAIEGSWHWASDRSLQFTPTVDWDIDQNYRVVLDKKNLLAANVLLDKYSVEFKTKPFKVNSFNARLYEDPTAPNQKKMVATLRATHPLDENEFPKHALIELSKGLGYLNKGEDLAPQFFFSNNGLEVSIHSALLELPLETSQVKLTLSKGVRAQAGGNAIKEPLTASTSVTGLYQLSFDNAEITFVNNERGEPEPVLIFESSNPVSDENIKDQVFAWQLPGKSSGGYWSQESITEDVLQRSIKITLTHIPSDAPQNSLHAFKFRADPGRELYVRVNSRVKATGGYLSRNEEVILVERMPEYPKALSFLSEGALLSLNGEKNLGIMARGIKGNGKVEIARILPNQLHHLVNQLDGKFVRPEMSESSFDKLVERMMLDVPLSAIDPAKTQYAHVNLGPYLDADEQEGGRRGIFVLRLNQSEGTDNQTLGDVSETRDIRFIVVTDLGIIAKKTSDGSHEVFVQSISSGLPVAGAQVEVYGVNGLPVTSTQTDEKGRVHFDNLDSLKREKHPLMYVVTKGNDQSFLPIRSYGRQLDFSRFKTDGMVEGGKTNTLSAFLFSDRGLYRPGETVHLGMVVRAADWSGNLAGLPVELRITDPRGQTVQKSEFNLSTVAFESVDFTSNPNAPAGTYTAEMYLASSASISSEQKRFLGTVNFKVRDFEPDRMKVSSSLFPTKVEGWIKPDQVQAQVIALHLFGAPASDRRVAAHMRMTPASVAFQGYRDYRFYLNKTLDEVLFEELPDDVTDEQGQAVLDLNLKRFEASTYNLQILTQVFEAEGGRNVAADAQVMVSTEDFLLGVKTPDPLNYVTKNAMRKVHWVALAPDLQKIAINDLTYELIEVRYVSVLVKQNDGTYRYESRRKDAVVESKPFAVMDTGFEQTLKTDEPGNFIVNMKNGDVLLNQLSYSVAGNANTTRSLDRNAELQLNLNKETYSPGEEIEISIRAPYTGAGLITIERDKVYNHVWFHANTTSSVQRIKVPEHLEGNAYVNVQFVRSSDSEEIFMSPLSYGVAPFKISLDARRIDIAVNVPPVVLPGDTLPIKVNLNRAGRVVVYGVDEGILQVARYNQPKPLEYFFQKRALEVSTSQILDLILPEFSNVMRAAAAGGDSEGALAAHLNPFKRKNKPPVVWWSGIVSLPEGETTLTWDVPDYFNGKLHFFAVAVDEQHIGITQNYADVRGPVVLTPNVPAFVAPGDRVKVTTGVFSNLEQQGTIKVSLETSDGLQLALAEPLVFDIAPKREAVATFNLDVQDILGSADLRFIAELPDGKRIAISEAISIRPAVEHRVRLDLGTFTKKTFELKPERTLYAQLRSVNMGVAGSPMVWGSGLQAYLDNYAYSCTEQLLSKAMPAVVWGSSSSDQDVAAFNNAANVLRQRQNSSGGFGIWAQTPHSNAYVNLYAADFLIEAKERGYPVSQAQINYVNSYLSKLANEPSSGLGELRNRAYAVYLLTRQGNVTSNQLSSVRERFDTYFEDDVWKKDIAAVYMAASYRLLKQDKQANELIAHQPWLLLEKKWQSTGVYFDPLTHDAQYLDLLMKHFPERFNKIPLELLTNFGMRLSEQRYNSLSAALVVRALDSYEKQAAQRITVSATAQLAEQKTQLLQMLGKPPRAEVPIGTEKLIFNKTDGRTVAFYMFNETGYDKGTPDKPLINGLEIIHDYLDLEGKPIQQVKVGDEFLVRVRLRSDEVQAREHVAIVDLLPGGVEPVYSQPPLRSEGEDDDEHEGEESEAYWAPPIGEPQFSDWQPDFIDLRDDRVVIYGTATRDVQTFVYRIRAVNEGSFVTPPAYAESMYDPTVNGQGKAGRLDIVAP